MCASGLAEPYPIGILTIKAQGSHKNLSQPLSASDLSINKLIRRLAGDGDRESLSGYQESPNGIDSVDAGGGGAVVIQ